jgi:putative ABC transport system permease protein
MYSLILQAWRSWKSAKSVALLAVAALSILIGSASAIYTVVEAVLPRPLPYQHGERFAAIFNAERDSPGYSSVSFEDLKDYQKRTRVFDAFGIFQPRDFSLTSPG